LSEDVPCLSPEICALLGVYALYWKVENAIEETALAPRLGRLESRLLIHLDQPRRMGALAQLLLTGAPSVTAAADTLEKLELVERMPDPDDRRALLLHLTERGRQVRVQLQKEVSDLFREISGLSTADIDRFAALSMKIHDTILGQGARLSPQVPKGDTE
jgi:DNA-binding MarR family transcriptional regulator